MGHSPGTIGPFLQGDIADNILDEFFQITKKLKIKTCLLFGTCLGFIRDGGYIKDDNNLDVGVICAGEKREALIASLEKNGFTQGNPHLPTNSIPFLKNKVFVDVFFLEARGFYSSLDSVPYKGKIYPVPHPVKEFLNACYSNWKVKEMESARYFSQKKVLGMEKNT